MIGKSKQELANTIKELSSQVSKQLEELVKLDVEQLKYKNKDIKDMINYYNDLTHKIEDRRVRIHNFSLQILAVSLAALIIVVTSDQIKIDSDIKLILFSSTVVIFFVLIVFALVTSLFFIKQSSFRYPFLKLEGLGQNQWKWFYYGNKNIENISRNPICPTKDQAKTHIPYLMGMEYFIRSYTGENPQEEIRNNIQQLYLLQVHNYYKNKFYLQLTKIWQLAFCLVLLVIIVSFLLWLLPISSQIVTYFHDKFLTCSL